MATFTKISTFAVDLANAVHNLTTVGSELMVCLSNTQPDVIANAVLADITQIPYLNVVETFPANTQNIGAEVPSGNWRITGTDLTVTALGGAVPTFRYAILYNNTPAGQPLIGYWDYGAPIMLADGDVFNITFGNAILNLS